jgi:molecular chaperone DnaK
VLLDVTPLSLGIETLGGVFTRIIKRNTTIPTRKSDTFSTAADNQTSVTVKVLQGEREMAMDNKQLGIFELGGIPPAPRGVPQIEVIFDIDANGIVHVSAKDKATGKQNSVTVTSSGGLSKEDIERMVQQAEELRQADERKRESIDTKNNADAAIYNTEKMVNDYSDKIDSGLKDEVNQVIAELKGKMEADDLDGMKESLESLNNLSGKIGESIHKSGGGSSGDNN